MDWYHSTLGFVIENSQLTWRVSRCSEAGLVKLQGTAMGAPNCLSTNLGGLFANHELGNKSTQHTGAEHWSWFLWTWWQQVWTLLTKVLYMQNRCSCTPPKSALVWTEIVVSTLSKHLIASTAREWCIIWDRDRKPVHDAHPENITAQLLWIVCERQSGCTCLAIGYFWDWWVYTHNSDWCITIFHIARYNMHKCETQDSTRLHRITHMKHVRIHFNITFIMKASCLAVHRYQQTESKTVSTGPLGWLYLFLLLTCYPSMQWTVKFSITHRPAPRLPLGRVSAIEISSLDEASIWCQVNINAHFNQYNCHIAWHGDTALCSSDAKTEPKNRKQGWVPSTSQQIQTLYTYSQSIYYIINFFVTCSFTLAVKRINPLNDAVPERQMNTQALCEFMCK